MDSNEQPSESVLNYNLMKVRTAYLTRVNLVGQISLPSVRDCKR